MTARRRMMQHVAGALLALGLASGALAQTAPETTPAPAPAAATPAPQPVTTLENRQLGQAELVRRLRAGGLVILMRHERTEVPSRGDDYSRPVNDCSAQRNLSVAGIAGAAETGVAIRALEWPFDNVISSPMCRSTETARYAFGRYTIDDRLMHHDNTAERTVTVSGQQLNALLASLSGHAGNVALVSHIGNIYFAIGIRLSEGEFAVLERQADGGYVILGTMDPGYIGAHARTAQSAAARARTPAAPASPPPATPPAPAN